MTENFLDLRGIACPMNFVKTKLFLDKMPAGETLKVFLDHGEPVESVCASVQADGHVVAACSQAAEGHYVVLIDKNA